MKLGVLDFSSKLFADLDLSKTLVIACQHILETNLIMFEYLFDKGLSPQNTFLLGKCYSTNKDIMKGFEEKGVHVHKGSLKFDSHKAFDEIYKGEVRDFFEQVVREKNIEDFEKVLLVDDGGYLIDLADSVIKNKSNFVGIEQTSSGYNKIKDRNLGFPVINVARSEAKLRFESPFIAEAIVENIKETLVELKLSPKKALVIGSGDLGKRIFDLICSDLDVRTFDVRDSVSDFDKIDLNEILFEFDLVIGATGVEVFDKKSFDNLKRGSILISASSSDREFLAVELRKNMAKTFDCHKNFLVRGIYLLNAGFPINFSGKRNSAKPEDIQLTRSLIFSAICLAVLKDYSNGVVELDENVQEKIVSKFLERRSVN